MRGPSPYRYWSSKATTRRCCGRRRLVDAGDREQAVDAADRLQAGRRDEQDVRRGRDDRLDRQLGVVDDAHLRAEVGAAGGVDHGVDAAALCRTPAARSRRAGRGRAPSAGRTSSAASRAACLGRGELATRAARPAPPRARRTPSAAATSRTFLETPSRRPIALELDHADAGGGRAGRAPRVVRRGRRRGRRSARTPGSSRRRASAGSRSSGSLRPPAGYVAEMSVATTWSPRPRA